jgi:hypothetical protein
VSHWVGWLRFALVPRAAVAPAGALVRGGRLSRLAVVLPGCCAPSHGLHRGLGEGNLSQHSDAKIASENGPAAAQRQPSTRMKDQGQGLFKGLELLLSDRGKGMANRPKERLQVPLRIFVTPKELWINQKPEPVTGPVLNCFSESRAMVAKKAKCFCHGLFDGVPGKFAASSGMGNQPFVQVNGG